jgi:hypothetical protein
MKRMVFSLRVVRTPYQGRCFLYRSFDFACPGILGVAGARCGSACSSNGGGGESTPDLGILCVA